MMIESGFYNMDCMEAMKQFPDRFFDLAIVDPPYGDPAGKIGGATVRRMFRPLQGGTDSGSGSTDTSIRHSRISRGGGGMGKTNTISGSYQNRRNLG